MHGCPHILPCDSRLRPGQQRAAAVTGFTLVELLIVLVLVGILAAIVVPGFGASSEDAKVSGLRSNLIILRRAISLYQAQHGGRLPGLYRDSDGVTRSPTRGLAKVAFTAQLTRYSDTAGKVSTSRSSSHPLGPYLKEARLPANPMQDAASARDVFVDLVETDITAPPAASGNEGWKFYLGTGRLVANDGVTLSDGTTRTVDF